MSSQAAQEVALPLRREQLASIRTSLDGLTAEQRHWVSGYVAGLAHAESTPSAAPTADNDASLTVLYGSQTGNGEKIAQQLAVAAQQAGFVSQVRSLADYKPATLKRESLVAFIVSTHGEGDPPDDAELFRDYLLSTRAPQLGDLRYAVLALGDSSYVNFCQTGREFDARLEELGATRLHDLIECDLDFAASASAWQEDIVEQLPDLLDASQSAPQLRAVQTVATFDRERPFTAEVLTNQKITGAASSKDVRHIELSLDGADLTYEPGDALAVIAKNPPQLVAQLLQATELSADERVTIEDDEKPLGEVLLTDLEITAVNLAFLRQWANLSADNELQLLLKPGNEAALSRLLETHQIIDVVRHFPTDVHAQTLVNALRPLSPRSYSIASSQSANPDEVHLTVAAVRYDAFGHEHVGAASTHLADRLPEGAMVDVFVETNHRFRLPSNETPIIMIGPGTGIAPFRAFVEERIERGASGKNWLFFGDRNFSSDFLYQLEWQRYLKQGHLDRLTVAFSRDQQQKVYVQDQIRKAGADIYDWIVNGAVIYVCGDAKNMAGDVERALTDVIVDQACVSMTEAQSQLKQLRRDNRYQRDVY